MELRDDQVLRYSRQILLREVGGAGQRAWLDSGVRVVGSGPALETAVAYLAAAGLKVDAPEPFWASCAGWLNGAALDALNPDSQGGEPPVRWVSLVQAPGEPTPSSALHCVLGAAGEGAVIICSRCARCAASESAGMGPLAPGPLSVLVGAHAARAIQQALLPSGSVPLRIRVGRAGESVPQPLEPCSH